MEQNEQKRETRSKAHREAAERKQLMIEERYRISESREFWSGCVCCVLSEGADEREAERAIQIADRMVEARRLRFPY